MEDLHGEVCVERHSIVAITYVTTRYLTNKEQGRDDSILKQFSIIQLPIYNTCISKFSIGKVYTTLFYAISPTFFQYVHFTLILIYL